MYIFFLGNVTADTTTYVLFSLPTFYVFVMNILQYKYKDTQHILTFKYYISILPIIFTFVINIVQYNVDVLSKPEFLLPLVLFGLVTLVYLYEQKWVGFTPSKVFEEKENKKLRPKKKMQIETLLSMLFVLNFVIMTINALFNMIMFSVTDNPINGYIVVLIPMAIVWLLMMTQRLTKFKTLTIILKFFTGNFMQFVFIGLLIFRDPYVQFGEAFVLSIVLLGTFVISLFEIVFNKKYFAYEVKLVTDEEAEKLT